MSEKKHIFFVEDDLSFGAVLKSYLELNDLEVSWVEDGEHALKRFREGQFDICLLDVMLPNIDGFTIGKEIRKIDNQIPFIFLTAKALKEDVLHGFDLGADDYITKPFDTEVLICKIKAILNRNGHSQQEKAMQYKLGRFTFDVPLRTITSDNSKQSLSPKESDLLQMLCEHKNELLPRETALKKIWGDEGYFTARSMDVYITKLRKYLADDPSIQIKNIHGSGFLLKID